MGLPERPMHAEKQVCGCRYGDLAAQLYGRERGE